VSSGAGSRRVGGVALNKGVGVADMWGLSHSIGRRDEI
jgi:hypothetical protein